MLITEEVITTVKHNSLLFFTSLPGSMTTKLFVSSHFHCHQNIIWNHSNNYTAIAKTQYSQSLNLRQKATTQGWKCPPPLPFTECHWNSSLCDNSHLPVMQQDRHKGIWRNHLKLHTMCLKWVWCLKNAMFTQHVTKSMTHGTCSSLYHNYIHHGNF